MADQVHVGIIGFGFMGHTHAGAYAWAGREGHARCEVVGIADSRGTAALEAHTGNLASGKEQAGLEKARFVTDHRSLLDDPSIDLVSICTPTDTHVDLAIEALAAGKHVVVEKPVAVRSSDAERLREAGEKTDRICMPAMCMRFWPGWHELKVMIEQRSLGAVVAASFLRIGSPPSWSGFYADSDRSGGAILDLHIHDVDFILHCFGEPESVVSVGSASHISSQYRFASGPPMVVAEGGWLRSPHTPFTMRYTIEFERGVVAFDLSEDPASMVHDEHGSRAVEIAPGTGYDHQAAAIVRAILEGGPSPVSLGDAATGLRIVEAERRSAASGAATRLRDGGHA